MYSDSEGEDDCSEADQSSSAASYPPLLKPPADTALEHAIAKTAASVAQGGEALEQLIISRHAESPTFAFLFPWNEYHAYYRYQLEAMCIKRTPPVAIDIQKLTGTATTPGPKDSVPLPSRPTLPTPPADPDILEKRRQKAQLLAERLRAKREGRQLPSN
ncbi:hypothetical protein IWQ60_004439 [Tieghemiomyces parasiticus]|uniref:SURP motif domain-containing protein n=1 Tax=Tieghemiomyces parasiticus TaxID=78921 RepID=A0A9W8AG97_9FUNG|nr:hypothetical protein IWQ60_004439 [Tieghemiomyces parasiticus]